MKNRWDLFAFASVVAGVVIRIIWGLVIHPPIDYLCSDLGAYAERAQRLATDEDLRRPDSSGGRLPTLTYPMDASSG